MMLIHLSTSPCDCLSLAAVVATSDKHTSGKRADGSAPNVRLTSARWYHRCQYTERTLEKCWSTGQDCVFVHQPTKIHVWLLDGVGQHLWGKKARLKGVLSFSRKVQDCRQWTCNENGPYEKNFSTQQRKHVRGWGGIQPKRRWSRTGLFRFWTTHASMKSQSLFIKHAMEG